MRGWRLWGWSAAAVVAVLAVVLVGIGWVGAERTIHPGPPDVEDQHTLAEYPALASIAETVSFVSRDGTRLVGWFIPARPSAGTIVVLHGYGADRGTMLPQASYLHAAGYSQLYFDFRGGGESGGDAVTVGYRETGDALGAMDYLEARGDVDMRRVGMLGISMGGAVAIMAAAQDERVAGVVAEAPFKDVPSIIGTQYEHQVGLPEFPFAPVTVAILEWRLGVRAADISPIRAVAGMAGRPLLLIEDGADVRVLSENQRAIFEAAGEPKGYWVASGAAHGKGHTAAKAEYEQRVLALWERVFSR